MAKAKKSMDPHQKATKDDGPNMLKKHIPLTKLKNKTTSKKSKGRAHLG